MNKELLRMKMLAGIITESQYKAMLNEEMFAWHEGDLTQEELKKVQDSDLKRWMCYNYSIENLIK